ncbi:metal-dependent hydrolase [Erwinia persicina]|uniref:metal-dependent hydrolase n=1 Tax=Erwinia persicina TaxID=55211 RepID=UPI0017841841|nr:metal-dependent hydrolase [Erwinia persicina]MBD8163280.1 metal-dependent hydrolase [Erwinia persicina]
MDSVSQLLLGASVGVAVMGRRVPVWQAAAVGAVCGTLPDLDVFIDHGDAIRNMTLHRTESHALFWLSLVSPLLAWLVSRLARQPQLFPRWWGAVWLALITHPLLDLTTVYGTQLALPFTDRPFAIGSMFIIDPLYTLPLLVGVIAALVWRHPRGSRWNRVGLSLSCLYLLWSMGAQAWVRHQVEQHLVQQDDRVQQLLVTPTAFNTLQWRVVVMTADRYQEGFYSLLSDKPLTLTTHDNGSALYQQFSSNWYVQRVVWFSRGFYAMKRVGEHITITDLRMGEEPDYSFTFDLGPEPLKEGPFKPERVSVQRPPLGQALHKLWSRF